jgi:hypothetical protein
MRRCVALAVTAIAAVFGLFARSQVTPVETAPKPPADTGLAFIEVAVILVAIAVVLIAIKVY